MHSHERWIKEKNKSNRGTKRHQKKKKKKELSISGLILVGKKYFLLRKHISESGPHTDLLVWIYTSTWCANPQSKKST